MAPVLVAVLHARPERAHPVSLSTCDSGNNVTWAYGSQSSSSGHLTKELHTHVSR